MFKFLKRKKEVEVLSPLEGKVLELSSLKDGVFSEKIMGDGIAILPKDINSKVIITSPISGKLVTVFRTGHAFGIENEKGHKILIHIGIDTVNLQGEGFKTLVTQDQKIKANDPLVEVDFKAFEKKVPSIATIIVNTPDSSGQVEHLLKENDLVNIDISIFKII